MNTNPSACMTEVAQTLADAQESGHLRGLLIIRDKVLAFVESDGIKVGDIVVFKCSNRHITTGLTAEEWFFIIAVLRKYQSKHGFYPRYMLN